MGRFSVSEAQVDVGHTRVAELWKRYQRGDVDPDVTAEGLQVLIEGRFSAGLAGTFVEQTLNGHLVFVNELFHPEHDPLWEHKGRRVRGEFVVRRLGGHYYARDLRSALHIGRPSRDGELRLATAYEAAAYAALGYANGKLCTGVSDERGWNGYDPLVAFGSIIRDYRGDHTGPRKVPILSSRGRGRGLDLGAVNQLWHPANLILLVRV
jgi:hypothetical protein